MVTIVSLRQVLSLLALVGTKMVTACTDKPDQSGLERVDVCASPTYTGNSDHRGDYYEGPIQFKDLGLNSWLERIRSLGGNVTDLKMLISASGSVTLPGDHDFGLTIEELESCATNVARTSDGQIQLSQLDYIVFMGGDDIGWQDLQNMDGQQMIHANFLVEGTYEEPSNIQQAVEIDIPAQMREITMDAPS